MIDSNLKDKITTYVSFILVIIGALHTFLQANAGKPIDWMQLTLFIGGAIIAYFTGKTPAGTTKTEGQVIDGNRAKPNNDPPIPPKV